MIKAIFKPFRAAGNWLNGLFSSSDATSNSRVLQTLIVTNIIVMLWLVLKHASWVISDNARLVMLGLIGGGAGAYITNKVAGIFNQGGSA